MPPARLYSSEGNLQTSTLLCCATTSPQWGTSDFEWLVFSMGKLAAVKHRIYNWTLIQNFKFSLLAEIEWLWIKYKIKDVPYSILNDFIHCQCCPYSIASVSLFCLLGLSIQINSINCLRYCTFTWRNIMNMIFIFMLIQLWKLNINVF